ncbi:MAG: phosphatase PAP2 family protein [Halothiobacillaceae bacterium]|nr:phosphatase PAP2 family protein [Halothiobacillaceae bacterium]
MARAPASRVRAVARRLACCWLIKALGTTGVMGLFFVAYFRLLDRPGVHAILMPETAVDRWVSFQPAFVYLYASLWLYVSLVPALMPDRRSLVRYGIAIGLVCVAGLAVFYGFPTRIERDPGLWANQPQFAWLSAVDGSGNAFPSLHVASAVFSAYWLDRIQRALAMPMGMRLLSVAWAVGIVYSTLAIAQHVAWDVVGGVVLALVGVLASAGWVGREAPRDGLDAQPSRPGGIGP